MQQNARDILPVTKSESAEHPVSVFSLNLIIG